MTRYALTLSLFACTGSGGSGTTDSADTADTGTPATDCTGEGTGDLSLVLELPEGLSWRQSPAVVVHGPDGSEIGRFTESTLLEDLPGGTYTLVVLRGETAPGGALTGEAWGLLEDTVVELCIGNNLATEHSLAWEKQPSSQHLWVSSGESLAAFTPTQVEAGGSQEADIKLDVGFVNDFRGFGFDRLGNLWAATSPTYGSRLLFFAPGQLQGRGEIEPLGELGSSYFEDFAEIGDISFSADGTLWVSVRRVDGSFHGLVGFSRATLDGALARGGAQTAEPDFNRPVDGLAGRSDLEPDAAGRLWITSYDGDSLLRIDDPTDGATTADAIFQVLTTDETPEVREGPENLAFFSSGDAVALFWTAGVMVRLSAGSLGAEGTHSISPTSEGELYVDQLPTGLVIDGADRVWMGNYAGDGTGQILSWEAGRRPEPWLSSADIVDPVDLVLDPRPR